MSIKQTLSSITRRTVITAGIAAMSGGALFSPQAWSQAKEIKVAVIAPIPARGRGPAS